MTLRPDGKIDLRSLWPFPFARPRRQYHPSAKPDAPWYWWMNGPVDIEVYANTRSEARGRLKKRLGLKRIPVGAKIVKIAREAGEA